jgi:hypothetical protein
MASPYVRLRFYDSPTFDCNWILAGYNVQITMPDSTSAMKTASRVLMAVTDRAAPDPDDVEDLLRLAPDCSALPIDELACEVVHRLLKRGFSKATVRQLPRMSC